ILGHAARRGAIPINPCSQLERGERPKLDDQRPKRILTLEEMQALLAAADCDEYRCLVELLLTAGLRIGEALGLGVCDLDYQHSLIRVEYQLGRDGTRTPLKTEESRRAIDIPPQLMRRLVALLRVRGVRADPAALVFASRNGSGLERKVAREALKRAVKTAAIPPAAAEPARPASQPRQYAHRPRRSARRRAATARARKRGGDDVCCLDRLQVMERLWSLAVATGCDRSQTNHRHGRLEQAKPIAGDRHRLPLRRHGKEGVGGSSPPEGFAKAPQGGGL
ncbi:MAG TPA: tyrosine-type recombinase/integrase, partial [Gaiellaceae bacterium]